MERRLIGTLMFTLIVYSPFAQATKLDDDFEEILFNLCVDFGSLPGEGWDANSLVRLNDLCLNVLQGGATPSSDYSSSSNIGSSGATGKTASNTAQLQVDSVKDRLAQIQEEEAIDEGGWGMLFSVQTGESERRETDNESGYESDLQGILAGGDYRLNDRLITGIALGYTTDTAEFDKDAGELDTTNSTLVGYLTYLPAANAYIDAYIGVSKLEFDSEREIDFQGTPASPVVFQGTARGDYEGDQVMAGVSGGYDWYFGNFSIGAFAALDISETDIDSYDEEGNTGFEFSYGSQEIESSLTTVGMTASYDINRRWGVLAPSFSVSSVHQSKDDPREFALQPSIVPGGVTTPLDETTLFIETDAPDRDYLITSLGVIAALNNGTQWFVTYEQMSSHDFLDTWSLSAGVVIEAF